MSGKLALKYVGDDLEAMRAIAQASQKRSLADFNEAQRKYRNQLDGDPVIRAHLATLYDKMMEQNLCRIIEPYSKVEVRYHAKMRCKITYQLIASAYKECTLTT